MKKYRVLAIVYLAAVIAFARPVAFLAQEAGKATEILALARKAIGGSKVDSLKTFSVQSAVQRNVGSMQLNSDVEILLELPDKYARTENSSGGPGMVIAGGGTTGFNGDRSLSKMPVNMSGSGGSTFIRMGGPAGLSTVPGDKLTPEQQQQLNQSQVRGSRAEISRLMLGWFAMTHPAANAQYSYAGEAESADGKAYVLDVKGDDGFTARLFIDEQTKLPLMVVYKAAQPRVMNQMMGGPGTSTTVSSGAHTVTMPAAGAKMTDDDRKKAMDEAQKKMAEIQREPPVMVDYTLFFDDWRDADGMKFPFKIRRGMAGSTTEEWTISKIKINPKIDAKKFAVDSGS